MKKFISVLLIALCVVMVLPTAISAATPYATYTYSASGMVLTSPAAYVPDRVVDSTYMGLKTAIDDPRDMFVGPDEKVYIVSAATNSVVVLDRYYKDITLNILMALPYAIYKDFSSDGIEEMIFWLKFFENNFDSGSNLQELLQKQIEEKLG